MTEKEHMNDAHPMCDFRSEHPLVGKAFLSYAPNAEGRHVVEWQGEVIAVMPSGNPSVGDVVLVQLADWFVGADSNCFLVPLSALAAPPKSEPRWFKFFHSAEARNSYCETWKRRDQ